MSSDFYFTKILYKFYTVGEGVLLVSIEFIWEAGVCKVHSVWAGEFVIGHSL